MGFRPMMLMIVIILFEMFFSLRATTRNATTRNATTRNATTRNASFDQNYYVTWGRDRILFFKHGKEVQVSLDQSSGGGFGSKSYYGSGFFQMRIKLPDKDSAGVVTAFYLHSNVGVHDELDFEFLGNRHGKPIVLQTNVFAHGLGGREQRTLLWFDPSADFHYYKLLWNEHQIVFFVDDIPIRVHKNHIVGGFVGYPQRSMQLLVSLWDGSSWATDGGKTKANWTQAPFQAHFQDFNIDGCPLKPSTPNMECYSTRYWWNRRDYWQLNQRQMKALENIRRKYMNYDYCTDKNRYPVPPPECHE